jgi:hypothetical protein
MEIKSKFNIGDTIFFMEGDMPVKETVSGITTFNGEAIHSNGSTQLTEEGKVFIDYHIKYRAVKVNEHKVYATKEELITATFASL